MKSHALRTKISYTIIRFLISPFIRFIWIKKIENIHYIKRHKKSAIVASNHQSFFDFLCLASAAGRNIHFLTAEKFFEHSWWKKLMLLTGQIKVDRHAKDKSDVHASVGKHMEKGNIVGIFPEGTRSPSETEMLKAFTGVAKYSLKHHVPIIPVGIRGTHHVMRKDDHKVQFKKTVEIIVGKPMTFEEYYNDSENKDVLLHVTEKVMKEIEKLSGKKYSHYQIIK